MQGSFWRCSIEQLRPATDDESLGAESVNRYPCDLRWDFQHNKGPNKYADVRAEGHPVFPDDDVDEAELPELVPSADEAPAPPREPMSDPATPSGPEGAISLCSRYPA